MKKYARIVMGLVALLGVAGVGACGTTPAARGDRNLPAACACCATDANRHAPAHAIGNEKNLPHTWSPPAMVKEAELPKGFPPPGPVGEVLVKHYPAYRAAVAEVAPPAAGNKNSQDQQNRMFWPLFKHIEKHDIPMTAPVELTFPAAEKSKGPESMAFLYNSPEVGKTGPDGPVTVRDFPAVTVVSVAVRGSYGEETFRKGMAKLTAFLDANRQWQVAGRPRYLAYNSPFIPGMFKLGEVQVPVTRAAK